MAGISPVNNSQTTAAQNSGTVQNPSGSLQVNQNQFIELFVAQLNRQDPLAPLDTNQMLTQLSQIS
ncbi:MAG: flagellar hook capping FlgD N-terminal domain-containing protein, partial [Endozoicomonas sp.]